MTISAEAQEVGHLVRNIVAGTGLSVIVQEGLETRPVSCEVNDVPVEDVIATLARRLGTQLTRTGDLLFLGDLRPEDRGVLVVHVGALTADERREVGEAFLSEHGRVVSLASGHLVCSDRVEVLAKIVEAADALRSVPRELWLVQLHVLSVREEDAYRFGSEPEVAIGVSASDVAVNASASVSAQLEAIRRERTTQIEWEPAFVCFPGEEAVFEDAERLPIVTRIYDGERNETRETVRYESIGRRAAVSMRPGGDGGGILTVELADESVTGFVEQLPKSAGYKFAGTVAVGEDSTVLVGRVRRQTKGEGRVLGLAALVDKTEASDELVVYARVRRVAARRGTQASGNAGPVAATGKKTENIF
ncbi:MAG: hypothetical protein AAGJ40_22065 [Planctomycetota bacterium]